MADQREFWESGGVYRGTDHPVVEIFARQRIRFLRERGDLDGVHSALDVGAGSGFSSCYYPDDIRVVACDYASGMLRGNPVEDRLQCSADAIPFPDGSFDLVSCWELLHHLPDPVAAVREMWRVTRRRLIIFEPNRINPGHIVLALTRENERESIKFTPGHMRRILRAAIGRTGHQQRCGMLFPNVTPLPIAKIMDRLPYTLPVIGVSQLLVVEKD